MFLRIPALYLVVTIHVLAWRLRVYFGPYHSPNNSSLEDYIGIARFSTVLDNGRDTFRLGYRYSGKPKTCSSSVWSRVDCSLYMDWVFVPGCDIQATCQKQNTAS
ncbi:hypothetical protein F4811DRAFT_166979 [Daldinia bambusicola]|nr:hypothetical protein F4811DRAFT_166979 [Daldinia bambusicola]